MPSAVAVPSTATVQEEGQSGEAVPTPACAPVLKGGGLPDYRYVNATLPLVAFNLSDSKTMWVYTSDNSPRLRFGRLRLPSGLLIMDTGTQYDNQIFPILEEDRPGVYLVATAPYTSMDWYRDSTKGPQPLMFILD